MNSICGCGRDGDLCAALQAEAVLRTAWGFVPDPDALHAPAGYGRTSTEEVSLGASCVGGPLVLSIYCIKIWTQAPNIVSTYYQTPKQTSTEEVRRVAFCVGGHWCFAVTA
jgi:hypothetical protein